MKEIKYSVLMSVYYKEQPEFLKKAIQCMLEQTILTNDFVIVKDGKLTEELEEVITYFTKQYPDLFNIIPLKENVGLGPALKIGIEKCKNEWIARMDLDDICLKNRCEEQIKIAQKHPELNLIGTNVEEFIDDIDNVISHVVLPETNEEIRKFARKRCPFRHPSIFYKKSMVLKAGSYREYYLCEDYDLWIRMIEAGAIAYNIQKPYVYMRISKDFYKRRGGIKYLKTMLKFKTEQYKKGFFSLKDYIVSSSAHIVVCLLPNSLREMFYKKILRK